MKKEVKYCINCGAEIKKSAEFCEKCGSAQSQTQTVGSTDTEEKSSPVRASRTESSSKKFLKSSWFWLLAIVLVVLVFFGGMFAVNYTKSPSAIANDIQSDIRSNSLNYGNATVTWNENREVMVVKVPKNSRVVKSVNQDETSLWNMLVRTLQDDSKQIAKKNNKKFAEIDILSPTNKKYVWLEIRDTKIKYNISDDID